MIVNQCSPSTSAYCLQMVFVESQAYLDLREYQYRLSLIVPIYRLGTASSSLDRQRETCTRMIRSLESLTPAPSASLQMLESQLVVALVKNSSSAAQKWKGVRVEHTRGAHDICRSRYLRRWWQSPLSTSAITGCSAYIGRAFGVQTWNSQISRSTVLSWNLNCSLLRS